MYSTMCRKTSVVEYSTVQSEEGGQETPETRDHHDEIYYATTKEGTNSRETYFWKHSSANSSTPTRQSN